MLDELEVFVMEIEGNIECDRCGEVFSSMCEYSERLVVVFVIFNISLGVEIFVIKNLRVCEDCYVFIKMVSKVVDCRFVVRDVLWFYYFEDGLCLCKDYW